MHIISTNMASPVCPGATDPMAMDMHSTIMACDPATMVPRKNMSANTKNAGMGRVEKNSGRDCMTPVAVSISLNIMISIANIKAGAVTLPFVKVNAMNMVV